MVLQGHSERLKQWVSMGLCLLIVAIILHFTDGDLLQLFNAAIFLQLSCYRQHDLQYFLQFFFWWMIKRTYPDFAAIPINKQLYSFSYVCFTAGAAGIVFSAFYIVVHNCNFTYFVFARLNK